MSAQEAAAGRWSEILSALGVNHKFLSGKHTACPLCNAGKDRFRFSPKTERGLWICNQCGGGNGFELLMRLNGWDFPTAAEEVKKVLGQSSCNVNFVREPNKWHDISRLIGIWNHARQIGVLVRDYLLSRDIQLNDHICCLREDDEAMVAMVTDKDSHFAQVHRTLLPSKKRLFGVGPIPDGSAVRLMPRQRGSILGIAEGIETALSAAELFNVPVWAALNAPLLRKWTPPDDVNKVIVFGDNDANYTGQAAAFALANKLVAKGIVVRVELPDREGDDWNDVLMRHENKSTRMACGQSVSA